MAALCAHERAQGASKPEATSRLGNASEGMSFTIVRPEMACLREARIIVKNLLKP